MTIADYRLRDLTPSEREFYEERVAIIEFDGRLPRADAEVLAFAEVMRIRAAKEILAATTQRKVA